jgi:hypothetical protein
LADFFKLKPPSRDEGFSAGMAAEKTLSPSRTRNGVIDSSATGELRPDDGLLQRDKDKSKEAIKNNSKKTKVQIQVTDEC